jgi:hypothetical protein
MNRNDIADGIAMLTATVGMQDAEGGKAPASTAYWYRVGYLMVSENVGPGVAMKRVMAHE